MRHCDHKSHSDHLSHLMRHSDHLSQSGHLSPLMPYCDHKIHSDHQSHLIHLRHSDLKNALTTSETMWVPWPKSAEMHPVT